LSRKGGLATVVKGLGAVIILLPVAIVATIMLVPFWSWLERVSGVETIGHSGPADWCYLAVYLLMVSGGAALWKMSGKRKNQDRRH
jgi:hypothetical protein